jgi:Uri superfamily endonuclease
MATYIVLVKVRKNTSVTVGRLGETALHRGFHLYIGSAKRTLEKRIERHLRKEKTLHWHIDHVLASHSNSVLEVWTRAADLECKTARAIHQLPQAGVVKRGLGSSDCQCPTHFYSFNGTLSALRTHLEALGFERNRT